MIEFIGKCMGFIATHFMMMFITFSAIVSLPNALAIMWLSLIAMVFIGGIIYAKK